MAIAQFLPYSRTLRAFIVFWDSFLSQFQKKDAGLQDMVGKEGHYGYFDKLEFYNLWGNQLILAKSAALIQVNHEYTTKCVSRH